MKGLEYLKRPKNLINRKILFFYIEAIPYPKKISGPKKIIFRDPLKKYKKTATFGDPNRKFSKSNRKSAYL